MGALFVFTFVVINTPLRYNGSVRLITQEMALIQKLVGGVNKMLHRSDIKHQAILKPFFAKEKTSKKNRVKISKKYTSKDKNNGIHKRG